MRDPIVFFRLFSRLCAWAVCWVAMASAHATPVVEYTWRPDAIYPIHAGIGIATQIVISPKEQVRDFGTGFSSAWDLVRRENVFYLKPKDPRGDTNMYIRTNKRSYLFDLRVVLKKWSSLEQAKRAGVHYQVQFRYPPGSDDAPPLLPAALAAAGEIRPPHQPVQNSNYDYAVGKDSDWLIPATVVDDGRFTYITLAPNSQPNGGVPTVYGKKKEDGEEFLINSRAQGQVITVFGLYNYLVLRHGDSVVGLRRNKP